MDSIKPGPKPTTNTFGFIDEIGLLHTPFYEQLFGIGFLKLAEPSILHQKLTLLRDKNHYYDEFKFADISNFNVKLYKELLDIYFSTNDTYFSALIFDKRKHTTFNKQLKNHHYIYNQFVSKIITDSLDISEYISILTDDISSPKRFDFEEDIKNKVKKRTRRNALFGIYRVDSKSVSEIQVTDVLLGSIGYAFKLSRGFVSINRKNAKFKLVKYLQKHLNIDYLAEDLTLKMRKNRQFAISEYTGKINADGALN